MRGQGLSLFLVLLSSFIVTLTGLNQSSVYFTALAMKIISERNKTFSSREQQSCYFHLILFN